VVRPTVRIGDSQTGETVGNGALATVRWYDGEPVGDGHLQGQFAAFKDVVGDMLDKGVFTPSTARQYLKRKLARAGRRPTGAAHSDRGITLREGESEPFIDQDCVDQLLFFSGAENRALCRLVI